MGVMIPMKRERMLTIRVTDDEHARLLERCEGKQLAVWMRRDQRKITQGQCQRFVNTDVGVPQGSQQHPAMQIRNMNGLRFPCFVKSGNAETEDHSCCCSGRRRFAAAVASRSLAYR